MTVEKERRTNDIVLCETLVAAPLTVSVRGVASGLVTSVALLWLSENMMISLARLLKH